MKKALELNPADRNSQNLLGGVYGNLRQYAAAVDAFTKVIELAPTGVMGYGNRGETYIHMGAYQDALRDLNRAARSWARPTRTSRPAWPGCWPPAPAKCEHQTKRWQLPRQDWRTGADRSRILGAVHYRLGQYEQAKKVLLSARNDAGDHLIQWTGEDLLFLAMTCRQLGEHGEAQQWLAQAETRIEKEAGPEDVHLQNIRQEATALLALVSAAVVSPRTTAHATWT